jgi:hypothetical protein
LGDEREQARGDEDRMRDAAFQRDSRAN